MGSQRSSERLLLLLLLLLFLFLLLLLPIPFLFGWVLAWVCPSVSSSVRGSGGQIGISDQMSAITRLYDA